MSDTTKTTSSASAAPASPRSKQTASANTAAPALSKNDNASALKVAAVAPVMPLSQAPLVEPFKPFSAPSSLNKDSFFGQPIPKGSMSIRNTLKGHNIFVTGITGFLGKVFLERLIRTYFNEIGHIYVLIRPSRKQTVQQRLQQLLSNPLFNTVKKQFADRKVDFNQWIEENVVLLRGDLTLPLCGLSPENLALLRDNLHCVMHVAASVEFNKPLREALQSNVYGALQVLEIAQMCPVPPAFVYVSTAYVNSCKKPGTTCYESVYKVDFPVDALMEDYNNGKYLHDWLPYISGWPNTYTATKAVAETLLNMRRGRVPVVICRPSIVTPTALEPITGWTDSLAGMAPCYLGVAMGLRFWYAKRTSLLDHIPVDCVISAMLGALAVSDSPYYRTWLQLTPGTPLPLATARNSPTELIQGPSASHATNIQVPVSNLPGNKLNNLVVVHSTSYRQPRAVGEWARTMRAFAIQNPVFAKSFPEQIYVSSRVWNLTHQVQSAIPSKVLSTVATKTANPKLQNMSKQLDKFSAMAQRINASFGFFMSNDWHFVDNNLVQLFRQYVPDKEATDMTWDVAEVDWNSYIRASVVGYHAVIDKFRSKL